ncbi:probable endonuclease/exonuclease/phosphatase family protein [Fusarium mangiferae]|uniref:Probable endonuclease/exonuclease/phosphatase family protein n=1 Tax=Fusarium mangiferae TaxID=192010 RepID=A0A1L7TFT9_FUSMA|nr:putative endonuclease/exonuclease/phosphatase family protein [Fusarium mangiferae]CVK93656.1 probable endonuclease/exonuclease/phosphatase family protein [Fusarium mangiferae]
MKLQFLVSSLISPLAAALTIAEINGNSYLSSYAGKNVTGVEGLVTAVGSSGFYLRSTKPDRNSATSEGLYIFGKSAVSSVSVGDVVTLDGLVEEYRSNKDYVYLTEISSPKNIVVKSSDNKFKPKVIGKDTGNPPGKQFSKLDDGNVFAVPNNESLISVSNPKLQPNTYGLDFWESLVGELVTVPKAYALSRPNNFGDFWVRGNWKVSGLNKHGGLTMVGSDANPEAIIIGSPLDGTKNPSDTKLGDYVGDITGVVSYAFGFYRILPLTATKVSKPSNAEHPAVSFTSKGSCKGITVADYNTENLNPASAHLPLVIKQIVEKLRTPDLLFLQEVQDNSGATNDGVVSANQTLAALADGIEESSGVVYEWAEVEPDNNEDGGQPGGNIRQAYLYRPDRVELVKPNQGGPNDVNAVVDGPSLKYNPGRIDPANPAWDDSRKPLVAEWKPVKGTKKSFFTVNVHFGSKGGSTSLHGDARTPVNKGVEKRTKQSEITANFIAEILKKDKKAHVIAAGDFNEFAAVAPLQTFVKTSGLVDVDEAAKIPETERYTYLFDSNCQALDHMYISKELRRSIKYEHLHINTWQNTAGEVSDHDPSVAMFDLC